MNTRPYVVGILISICVFSGAILAHRLIAFYYPPLNTNTIDLVIYMIATIIICIGIYTAVTYTSKVSIRQIKHGYRLRLADAQYKKLMEDSGISTITIDRKGTIRFLSENIGRLTNYHAQYAVGTDLMKGIDTNFRQLMQDAIDNIDIVKEYEETIQLQVYTKQRIKKWVSMRIYPLRDSKNDINELLLMVWDIDKEKKMEEELRNLEEMQKKQEEQSRLAQEVFLANVSHEIRTPLNGIVGMGNLLLGTKINEEQKEYLESIEESAKNLLAIINDLLDFSKIKSGKFHLEDGEFKPREVIKKTMYPLLLRANEKGIALKCFIDTDVPELLVGDSLRFQQVIINLIANAIKFTEIGFVEVKVYPYAFENNNMVRLCVDVTDTGIGIPEEKIANVFESYVQSDTNISRIYGGTGLGLAIVKQLAEMQNGTVFAKSVVGSGSTFTIQIPYKITNSTTGSTTNNEENEIKQNHLEVLKDIKILVVEDNLINQKVVKQTLIRQKAEVEIADNGKIAIKMMGDSLFDIVLMDIQMPEMDGYEATKHIRTVMKSKIPIVAMTADALQGESDKCFEIGMNDYISKPFEPGDLYNKILHLTQKV